MQKRLFRRNTVRGVALKHLVQQVQPLFVEAYLVGKRLLWEHDVALREEGKFLHLRPLFFRGGASKLEDLLQLLLFIVAGKEGLVVYDLCEDTANRPYVDRGAVVLGAHQHVRRTVPQGDNLVREVFDGDAERTGQTEISEL
jgi:hypothetical protein